MSTHQAATSTLSLPTTTTTTMPPLLIFLFTLALLPTLFLSIITLFPLYFTPSKRRSGILSFLVSSTMTVLSIPFVMDFVSARGDVKVMNKEENGGRRALGELVCASFGAYLVCDLVVGWNYYREVSLASSISPKSCGRMAGLGGRREGGEEREGRRCELARPLFPGVVRLPASLLSSDASNTQLTSLLPSPTQNLTLINGLIHHTTYLLITTLALLTHQSSIFALAAFLELPTFFLALANVFPTQRNDWVFAGSFLATRITLHGWICWAFGWWAMKGGDGRDGRGVWVESRWVEEWAGVFFLWLAFPL